MSNLSTKSTGTSSSRARGRVFGVPKRCWCGEAVVALISKSDPNPYRRYYRCSFAATNKLRNDEHTFKWVDEALLNEVDALISRNAGLEQQLKELRTERLEFDTMVYEKMEKEVLEKVEDGLGEAKSWNKKMMSVILLVCMVMIGLSKVVG
ncbi:PREDICTED: uncharacterized protein At4g04775-like [Camelina sativa]|uniref:Uncharacterized protein At4g04775-like n=1 Tax=Camelina sativa TaxID=90675 RepID=A0ABM0VJ53_CAMSA|nr:PREDICTED: uncharacterized protein At4g04775-like [Camelina sativa]XP_010501678.1 PREDICTED: uncharacterized protein At4g04775-like [Camelina sativa]